MRYRAFTLLLFAVSFLIVLQIVSVVSAQAPVTCPDLPESRMVIGLQGRLVPGYPNRVRSAPSLSGEVLVSIEGGTAFTVLAGPTCADGYAWWQIDVPGVVNGWTVEAVEGEYTMEVVDPSASGVAAGPVNFQGVSLNVDPAHFARLDTVYRPYDPIGPMWLPEYVALVLYTPTGQPAGEIRVMPAAGFNALPFNYGALPSLAGALTERPDIQTELYAALYTTLFPMLHFSEGNRAYLDFNNGAGTGVRSVVQMAEGSDVIHPNLHYVMFGLTSDQRHFVQVYIDITYTPGIPTPPVYDENADRVAQRVRFDRYFVSLSSVIDAAAPGEFSIPLDALDAMIASISVSPDLFAGTIPNHEAAATVAAPTAEEMSAINAPILTAQAPTYTALYATGETVLEITLNAPTFTYTPSLTPTITLTPSQTPTFTPTSTHTNCRVTAIADSRLRLGPDVNNTVSGYLPAGTSAYADAKFVRAGEDFPWWRLHIDTPISYVGGETQSNSPRWVRADFVTESDEAACNGLRN